MIKKIAIDYELLKRTPGIIHALVSGLPEVLLDANEGPGTWSPRQILGHLLFGEEDDWLPRTKIILQFGEDKPFTPFDREGFRTYEAMSLTELLNAFEQLRNENLDQLEELNISEDQLALTGIHPAFGKVTLGELISAWVVHDLGHIAQITRVLAKRYKNAAGPWEEYLPILHI
jgi:uncharacterized damage-inducible protein DinB